MTAPMNTSKNPPYKTAGLVLLVVFALIVTLVWLQFRGDLTERTRLTVDAGRAGLVMDPGSKVTYHGVEIGRVADVKVNTEGDEPSARILLNVDPKYIPVIPSNADAEIKASTVFGSKYVAFSAPESPSPRHISSDDVVIASNVTTEFNTLFQTVVSIAEQVDPIKLNQTLAATAQALDGLGDRFGESIIDGNAILADLNPQMPQIRYDVQRLADLNAVYANAAPDLFDALENAVTTARTLYEQRGNLDQALLASVGFGNNAGDVFERGGPYLVRGLDDLVTVSDLLDYHSPALFCTVRNFHDVAPKAAATLGGNGYSLKQHAFIMFPGNPYVYPDNLPRVNATGGPGGRPGCWQQVTRDLWPAPYAVMDTGASIAPYNHFDLGKPFAIEYVWGRQIGEYTINP